MKRVIIESPMFTRVDGTRCTPAEVARNVRYLKRATLDSLRRGEAPFASCLIYPQVLDDATPEERKLGIEAGLAWAGGAHGVAFYADHGLSDGVAQGLARHEANGIDVDRRYIGPEPEIANVPVSAVFEAVKYTLGRIQTDPNVGYYCGVGTQVFYLLCKAEAELDGRGLADVEANRRRNLTPAHREQRPDVEILRARIEELRLG